MGGGGGGSGGGGTSGSGGSGGCRWQTIGCKGTRARNKKRSGGV